MASVAAGLAFACSGGESEPLVETATATQEITGNCTMATFGLPCDPDGAGARTECEGICWVGRNGSAACVGIAAAGFSTTDMNGRVCGDATGTDCSQSCENGACVEKNATVGSACRLNLPGANTCSGQCTVLVGGIVTCQPAILPCVGFGRDDCTFTACDFQNNVSGCTTDYDLLASTPCNDGDACTQNDECGSTGVCEPGGPAPGCGTGGNTGAGGSGTGGAGGTSGGTGGAGGSAGGAGGTSGGTGGSAGGAGAGGGAGSSGMGGGAGAGGAGAAGMGGAAGSDGNPEDAGSASDGAAPSGDAASADGGDRDAESFDAALDGGSVGGGGGAGPTSGAGGISSAGAAGRGDPGTDAGTDADAGPGTVDYTIRGGACSCRVGAPPSPPRGVPWLGFAIALLAFRRRRRFGSRGRSASIALLAVLAAATAIPPQEARADGFNADRYTAPASAEDLLWTERAAPSGGHLAPFGRLTLGFADDPLIAVNRNDETDQLRLVDSQVAAYFSAGLLLWDRFQGALLLPVYLQSANDEQIGATTVDASGATLGNPGVDLRFVGLDRAQPVELALGTTVRLPGGPGERLAADEGVSVWPRVLVGTSRLAEGSYLGGSVGARIRRTATLGDLEVGPEMIMTLGGLMPLTEEIGLTAELGASSGFADFFAKSQTPVEITGGARYTKGPLIFAGGIGTGITQGYGAPDLRLLASVGYAPPTEPAQANRSDRDGDGIPDDSDECPDVAEDVDGFRDDDGCPDDDADGDGVGDAQDRCPGEPEDRDGHNDDDGCPDPDNDGDGIPDRSDRCPNEPEDRDGWRDDDGCPEADNDGDGILDAKDACPNEPETLNDKDDDDGCPDLVRVETDRLRTLEPIFFEYDKAKIRERSEPLLVEIAAVLNARVDLGRIAIEGHTDSRGGADYNLDLSQRRAEAVMKFLVDAGVDAGRLSAKGFGLTRPIAPNDTDAGRAKNRRVEFVFVDKKAAGSGD